MPLFANSLDPDHARHNVGPDLEEVDLEKNQQMPKMLEKLPSRLKVSSRLIVVLIHVMNTVN